MRKNVGSLALLALTAGSAAASPDQVPISSREVPVIAVDGLNFRDLDRNGRLDRYEDWRLTSEPRADDLLGRMTLPEKAGQMMVANAYPDAPFGAPATGYSLEAADALIAGSHISALNSMLSLPPAQLAKANNALQAIAERQRLGIPLTLSTDPRNHFDQTAGASVAGAGFSQWPDPPGFGAIGDAGLVWRFASIARQEYRAVGFAMALSPQADLATEPRWPRISGTFGEDPVTVAPLVAAYVEGMQGSTHGVVRGGVGSVVKHWVGYGAAGGGFDAHNYYGRFGDLKSDRLDLHLRPFEAAFAVKPAGVMPAYPVFPELTVDGRRIEPVGMAYNAAMLGMLRHRFGYRGVVLSDWAVLNDCGDICRNGFPAGQRPSFEGISMAWGVEGLTQVQRVAKAINAGVDQFGGADNPKLIVDAVAQGLVSEAQVDQAVRRVLIEKFEAGLFDDPFVDPAAAVALLSRPEVRAEARRTQAEAIVPLEDRRNNHLKPGTRVFLRGMDKAAAAEAGLVVVDAPEQAEVAIVRLSAPHEILHPQYFFGSIQHEGSLAFKPDDPDLVALQAIASKVPAIVDIYLDRPAILTPIRPLAAQLFADFGASDAALLDVLAGRVATRGRLPFELPSSMAAVERQRSDTPADSRRPLYPLHYRLKR